MSKAWYKNDLIVPYEELKKYGVDTVITENEIKAMFNR